jgi:ribokinase
MKYAVLSIGDITTDAFIKVSDAHVHQNPGEGKEICFRFGEKVPFESVTVVKAVGNAGNAAVSVHRLGAKSGLLTVIGDDANGADCLAVYKEEGLPTDMITIQPGARTNYHYVLQYGAERTILVKQEPYTYHLPSFKNSSGVLELPAWIYLTSLGDHATDFHDELATFLEQNPTVKLAFQPGTFQMKMGASRLKRLYMESDVFVVNKEEAQMILDTTQTDVRELLAMLHILGPKIPVITDGPNGAYAYDSTLGVPVAYFVPMYPDPKPPVSRTGAGDAFASTLTTLLAEGMALPEALLRAPINSMNVVQHVGAQKGLLTRQTIEKLVADAPSYYTVTKIG